MTFRVGQKVVCVDDTINPDGWKGCLPSRGLIYTVLWVGIDEEDVMIDLVEMPSPAIDGWVRGYMAKCFRPLVERKTDISIFTAMLKPEKVNS